VKARVIYDNLAVTPRRFALSVLPHIVDLTSPIAPGSDKPVEEFINIGMTFSAVEVVRVLNDWGLVCRTQAGLEGFAHVSCGLMSWLSSNQKLISQISHLSDEHLPALTRHTKQFGVGTLHRARVIGHSPFDGVMLLSMEQKVLDQVFMQVDELHVGKVLKVGSPRRKSNEDELIDRERSGPLPTKRCLSTCTARWMVSSTHCTTPTFRSNTPKSDSRSAVQSDVEFSPSTPLGAESC